MRCIDFEYDGRRLSDYGCMICDINTSPGVETINIGSQLTLNTIRIPRLNKFKLSSAQYNDAYTITFQIAKTGRGNKDDAVINEFELARFMRWLNRKEYHKFKAIYENGECANVYYMGTFNIQMIRLCEKIIGLELTLQTNAPFGYFEPTEHYMKLTGTEDEYILYDCSDEAGYIYPDIAEIECLSPGDLIISNSRDECQTVIQNCIAGEIITLNGENKIIHSNQTHDRLYNDFNYHFLRIINDPDTGSDGNCNIFTSALPCNIRLVYSPVCKIGVI